MYKIYKIYKYIKYIKYELWNFDNMIKKNGFEYIMNYTPFQGMLQRCEGTIWDHNFPNISNKSLVRRFVQTSVFF